MQENILQAIDSYELSVNQRNLWSLHENEAAVFYNQVFIQLDNSVQENDLQEALQAVIQKNETLLFKAVKDASLLYPKQFIDQTKKLEFHTVEKTGEATHTLADRHLGYAYDIFNNMPVRCCYLTSENSKELIIRIYSFWADSYSAILFADDLKSALNNVEAYKSTEREVVEYQNFAAWQNELFYEPEEEGVDFWKGYEYQLGKSKIPFIADKSSQFSPKRTQIATFEAATYQELKKQATAKNTTVEFLLFGKFINYLKKFEQEKITIGYVPFKRSYDELSNTFGSVTKTLPVVIDTTVHQENYEQLIDKNLSAIDVWSDYFYINREKSNEPKQAYFNYNFEYINVEKQANNTLCNIKDVYSIADLFDVKISCVDDGVSLSVYMYYDTNKIEPPIVKIVQAQLSKTYAIAAENVAELSVVEAEIITKVNQTDITFSDEASILELIANKATQTPNATAIVDGNNTISYQQLEEKSNQLAKHLITAKNIQKGDAVGILLERSESFIIAMLAILKSGAFYIPIDTEYPAERIQFILQDCKAKLLVTDAKTIKTTTISSQETVIISDENNYQNDGEIAVQITKTDIAYSIYTSGSTGNPKGCSITHGNLLNYIQWANAYYFGNDAAAGNWGLFTSLSFDLTVTALFTSLTRGKQLHIGSTQKTVVELLEESFNNPMIHALKLTPTHVTILKDIAIENTSVRTIICGGEQLQKSQLEIIHNIHPEIKIYNEYGPTEATVGCIVKEVSIHEDEILIGKPIANTQIQILDDAQNQVGIGIYGEIYISGFGVSNGYINRPEMTADKFVQINNSLHYKTGDIGYWLPDGNIKYIGRADDQVKIRGYRIELGEIENELTKNTAIQQAIVLVTEEEDVKNLTAFLMTETALHQEEIRNSLRKNLPDYMIPAQYIQIAEIPLTAHGKIDKKELLKIREEQLSKNVAYVAPRTVTEEKVAKIWETLFDKEQIGINDDFFFLGGHSIKLIKLINQYQTEFDTKLEFRIFFENTTVASHATVIDETDKKVVAKIPQIPIAESYPISIMQNRIWLLSQQKERSVAYNMGTDMVLYDIDEASFENAIKAVVARHESLRTVFRKDENGDVKQHILSVEDLNLDILKEDISHLAGNPEQINNFIDAEQQKVFDLENGPLLRIGILKKSERESVFYYFMHHIIADGWSMDILTEEFEKYYQHYNLNIPVNLEPLPIQYKDFTVWQYERYNSPEFKEHQAYWNDVLSGNIPKLQLSCANKRPELKTYNGAEIMETISIEKINAFYESTKDTHATPFMNYLSVLSILCYQNSFQRDIIIGSPLAGRDHQDLKDQIGLFINTIPYRNTIDLKDTYTTFLSKVKKNVLDGFAHKEYPFDLMVKDSGIMPDLSRNPLFDVMLVLTHNDQTSKEGDSEKIYIEKTNSKFDMTFYIDVTENDASYTICYNTDLFSLEAIEKINTQFKQIIDLIGENSERSLEEYSNLLKEDTSKIEQQSFANQLNENLDEDF